MHTAYRKVALHHQLNDYSTDSTHKMCPNTHSDAIWKRSLMSTAIAMSSSIICTWHSQHLPSSSLLCVFVCRPPPPEAPYHKKGRLTSQANPSTSFGRLHLTHFEPILPFTLKVDSNKHLVIFFRLHCYYCCCAFVEYCSGLGL